MLLPIIMLVVLFCINNARRARLRNLNTVTWVIWTVLFFFIGMFAATFLLMLILVYKNPGLLALAQTNDREGVNKFVLTEFSQHELLYPALMFAGAFGGYLLIRYLIERRKPAVE